MGRMIRLRLDQGEALFYDQSRRGGMHGMRSAFDDLKRLHVPGRIVALVGGISIKKDSDWTRQAHHELAELINASPIDRLYTTGNYMGYVHDALTRPDRLVRHGEDIDELATWLSGELRDGDLLFMIGSAYLYLGRVADILLKRHPYTIVKTPAAEPMPCH
jgi:UDP-N-acetylmuramyl pentapeptide synthase